MTAPHYFSITSVSWLAESVDVLPFSNHPRLPAVRETLPYRCAAISSQCGNDVAVGQDLVVTISSPRPPSVFSTSCLSVFLNRFSQRAFILATSLRQIFLRFLSPTMSSPLVLLFCGPYCVTQSSTGDFPSWVF